MRPRRARRFILYVVAGILAVLAGVFVFSHFVAPHLVLRVAVGGDHGDSQKFMTTLATQMGGEKWRMRFRFIPFADPAEAARAMEAGKLDLMIARADLSPHSRAQTLVNIRRDAIVLVLPADSPVEKFADLANRTVAIPAGRLQKVNEALLDQLLDFYAVPRISVSRLFLQAADIGQAIRQKRAAAAFVVGAAGLGQVNETVASIRKATRKAPSLLDLEEASAIVRKIPRLETLEIPRGAVSGNPPIPDDTVNTLAASVRLLATSRMSNVLAGDIARIVTAHKAVFAAAVPGAAQIEAPDTDDKTADVQVHPGAAAFFSGDQPSLFDRFENLIYYGGFLASIIGSIFAWIVGRTRRGGSGDMDDAGQRLNAMLAAVRDIPGAEAQRRRELAQDLDGHADWALGELAAGRLEPDRYKAFEAVLARGHSLLARSEPGKAEAFARADGNA